MIPEESVTRDEDAAPIMIIGGRSGTSLLRAMLNAHPRIHLVQEAHFYPWSVKYDLLARPRLSLERFLQSFSFAWLRLDPDDLREMFDDHLPDGQDREAYRWVMEQVANRHGKPRFGDKSPLNSFYLRWIFTAFPQARVIDLIRDPRDALLSYEKTPMAPPTHLFALHAARTHARWLKGYEDRILTIRMEDLVEQPRETMEQVLEYVDEGWSDRVLEHSRYVPEDDPPYPWVLSASRPLRAVRSRWPERLPPEWVRLIESQLGEWMAAWGYEKAELSVEPSRWSKASAMGREIPETLLSVWRGFRLLVRLFGSKPTTPKENQELIFSLNPRVWERNPGWTLPPPPTGKSGGVAER